MTECPTCRGEGCIFESYGSDWESITGTFIPREEQRRCPACDGTGEAQEVEEEE